jgi:hypothetical protein
MNTFFRVLFLAFLSGILFFSCIKKITRQEVEDNLKTSMELFLNHNPRNDSTLKFKVLTVVYFEDKKFYECEFKVNMKQKTQENLIDTTGTMSARISKDFTTVTRKN